MTRRNAQTKIVILVFKINSPVIKVDGQVDLWMGLYKGPSKLWLVCVKSSSRSSVSATMTLAR